MWKFSTVQRLEKRVEKLTQHFDSCVNHFNKIQKFSGPSLYFHKKTIQMHSNQNVNDLIQNELFLDYIYATLASWGMHRMGPGNTKLTERDIFRTSILHEKENIEKLYGYEIDMISDDQLPQISNDIYRIISHLQIGIGETKIVAGSKTLHHILPNLVPPIDGEYTMKFFFNNRQTALGQGGNIAYNEMYKHFFKIAKICKPAILTYIGSDMNTSKTKVIDNAIVGYCDLFKDNMD